MLFDLRARGRRTTVKVIYVTLAILMGGGLVLFGIGGATSGGLVDAITGSGGGGGGGGGGLQDDVNSAQKRVTAAPRNPVALAALADAQFRLASGSGDNRDQNTGQFTAAGKAELRRAAAAWQRYLALDPPKADPELAQLMVVAYSSSGLNQPEKAVAAQELVADADASVTNYAQLAILAYAAGQARKGDLAAGKAVELAPADERKTLRERLAAAKKGGGGTGQQPAQ